MQVNGWHKKLRGFRERIRELQDQAQNLPPKESERNAETSNKLGKMNERKNVHLPELKMQMRKPFLD